MVIVSVQFQSFGGAIVFPMKQARLKISERTIDGRLHPAANIRFGSVGELPSQSQGRRPCTPSLAVASVHSSTYENFQAGEDLEYTSQWST